MIVLLYILGVALFLAGIVGARGGLSNVARGRKYKSGTRSCFWRWTDVRSEYILRLHIVKTPWCALCLHWIRKPDPEPHLHDHPVTFFSLFLRGHYAELRQKPGEQGPKILLHRWFNWIHADGHDKHKIIFARKNTLTLCFMGPKTREWGYHNVRCSNDWMGWKAYEAYIKSQGELLDKTTWPVFYKDLDERIDAMSRDFIAKYTGKIFVDEDVRIISTVAGDFDDEAPTEPRK